jgi:hypothetical protein
VEGYADALAKPVASTPATAKSQLPDITKRTAVQASAMHDWLGLWRDPWFGDVRICAVGKGVEWRSEKSEKMHGQLTRLGGRTLLVWGDEAVDENAWLNFTGNGQTRRLRMAKFDPHGDFSSDYEDLDFQRVGDCD